jgi:hypothetical protein
MRQEIFRRALGGGDAADADAPAIANATVRALRLLLAELDPLVGERAVLALYSRSLHLTRSTLPWLTATQDAAQAEALNALHEKLAARAPLEARAASQALMLAFAGLLISLIGEPLTDRLLLSAWGGAASGEPAQEKPL